MLYRKQAHSGAIVMLLLVLITGSLIIAASDATEPPDAKPIHLPDTLLVWTTPQQFALSDGSAGTFRQTFTVVNPATPVLSPDGQKLIFADYERSDGAWKDWVTAVDPATLEPLWKTDLCVYPALDDSTADQFRPHLEVVATSDTVYIASNLEQNGQTVTILAVDSNSGKQTGRWSMSLDGHMTASFRLFVAPDQSELSILAYTYTNSIFRARIQLPDGKVLAQSNSSNDQATWPSLQDAHITPDGYTIYGVAEDYYAGKLTVPFIDLRTGNIVTSINVPFDNPDGFPAAEQVVSHAGNTLYLLAPASSQLATIDLVNRKLERIVPVDTGLVARHDAGSLASRFKNWLTGLVLQPAAAKFYLPGDMQLSPDGAALYAVGVTSGSNSIPEPDGIWVIDLKTAQVIDRWQAGERIERIIASADGRYLYAQAANTFSNLRIIDTSNGTVVDSIPGVSIQTMTNLFQSTYGYTPDHVGNAAAISKEPAANFRLSASVSSKSVLPEEAFTITAKFVTPVSNPVDVEDIPTPDQILAEFTRADDPGQQRSVELSADDAGIYQGTAALPAAGEWDLRVSASYPDQPERWTRVAKAINVKLAFTGSDGRQYVPRFSTDVVQPLTGESFSVSVAFVDALSGAPLPEGVRFPSFELPDSVQLSMRQYPEHWSRTELTLPATGYGTYSRSTMAPSVPQEVSVAIPTADGTSYTFNAGFVSSASYGFHGADGEIYVLRLNLEPASPEAGQPVEIRPEFVNITTGKRLANTTLDEGLPENIAVSLRQAGGYGAMAAQTIEFKRAGDSEHDTYPAHVVTFNTSSPREAIATLSTRTGTSLTLNLGPVAVLPMGPSTDGP